MSFDPCAVNIFNVLKNKKESYSHFLRHGNTEKLIANEVIFEVTKIYQEYCLNQLIHKFNTQINDDHPFLLYNSIGFDYYKFYGTNSFFNKPIIYILTRIKNMLIYITHTYMHYDCILLISSSRI